MRRVFLTLVILCLTGPLLMGCRRSAPVEIGRPTIMLPTLSDTCGSAALSRLIGQNFAELAGMDLRDLRIISPGQKVSEQISPSRMNVEVDAAGRIRRVYCG